MEELLNKLIEVDKNARKRVSKAKKANSQFLEELETKKQQLKLLNEEKFEKELEKEKAKQSELLKSTSNQIDSELQATVSKMNELYSREGNKWVDSIVNGVING